MATGCTVEGTAHHEMMHALGFKHEHVRHDRDSYLDVDISYLQTYKATVYHNYLRLDSWLWNDSGHPFELRSVMNYNGRSYMKTRDGHYWTSNRLRLTSTDALQIQWFLSSRPFIICKIFVVGFIVRNIPKLVKPINIQKRQIVKAPTHLELRKMY